MTAHFPMQSIFKLAVLLTLALLVVLAAIYGHQGQDSKHSRSWTEHVTAPSPKPAFLQALQGKHSMSLTSWLFQKQHSQVQGAHAPAFSLSINASALSPASRTAQAATCDVLALNGGPGYYNRVRFSHSIVMHASLS